MALISSLYKSVQLVMDYLAMKVLLTGGAGYVGSVLAQMWIDSGGSPRDLFIYDDLSTGSAEGIPSGVRFVKADILESTRLERAIKEWEIEAVIHLAAKLSVLESVKEPLSYYETNVVGTLRVIQACARAGVKKIIFSSTAAVYGTTENSPISEDSPKAPCSPYGASKLMAEQIIQDFAEQSGMSYIILRYFNVVGAMANLKQGSRKANSTHLLGRALLTAFGHLDVLPIYGASFSTKDGTGLRDYIHVEDLSEAHLLALRALEEKPTREIFNCGYGVGHSVFDIVKTLEGIHGRKIPIRVEDPRPGDVEKIFAESSRIRSLLGWVPKRSALKDMVLSAYEWESRLQSEKRNRIDSEFSS